MIALATTTVPRRRALEGDSRVIICASPSRRVKPASQMFDESPAQPRGLTLGPHRLRQRAGCLGSLRHKTSGAFKMSCFP
jgi:hypothetical protein